MNCPRANRPRANRPVTVGRHARVHFIDLRIFVCPDCEYIFSSCTFFVQDECLKCGSLYFIPGFCFGSSKFRVSDFNLLNLENSLSKSFFSVPFYIYHTISNFTPIPVREAHYLKFKIHPCPPNFYHNISSHDYNSSLFNNYQHDRILFVSKSIEKFVNTI